MAVQFILGRAGTGKTTTIVGQIVDQMESNPIGPPLIYIVPEQATFQAEYTLAASSASKGTIRAQVLSFGRLAYRIVQEMGGSSLVPVDELGKQMVLRMLLERHRDELQLFQRASTQPGFAEKLARMITECKTFGITAEQLQQEEWGTGTLSAKLHDLQLMMRAYEEYIFGQFYDTDDMLTRVASQIEQSRYLQDAQIWIDGFVGFTKQEYQILEQLMRHTKQVTIALTLDPALQHQRANELDVFYQTHETCIRLRKLAGECGVDMEEPIELVQPQRFANSPAIGHMEKSYFAWGNKAGYPSVFHAEEIEAFTASNRRTEVEAVGLKILKLAKEKGYRWREMAVMLRDATPYADALAHTFTELGIPYFLDQKRNVMHLPLIELVRSALEMVSANWRYEAVFRCLKTDLCSPHAEITVEEMRSEIDLLENYCLAYGIHGSQWFEESYWEIEQRDKIYAEIDSIRERYVNALKNFDWQMKQAAKVNIQAMVAMLYQLLVDLHIPEKLEQWQRTAQENGEIEQAREHGQVWNGLMELFDQIVEVMGDVSVDLTTFTKILESGLESFRLGLVPPAVDQVVIGQMERSRQPEVKAMFLLGANDGVLPMRPQEDGLLDEAEREKLEQAGIELAPSAKSRLLAEQFLLYQALTRPTEHFVMSCALSDEEGKALLPSSAFDKLKSLFPQLTIQFFHNEPSGIGEEDLLLVGRPKQVFPHLVTLLRQLKKGTPLSPFWWEVYDWFASKPNNARERWLLGGLTYTNTARTLKKETSRSLYGQKLRLSVSRLERFQACPFQHFASHGLRLKDRPYYRLERFDVGDLFHASLKRAVEIINEAGLDWGRLDEADSMRLAHEVVEEVVPQTRNSILNRTARYRFVTTKLKRSVGRAIATLGEHAKRSKFVPVGLEVSFGPDADAELPGLEFHCRDGSTIQLLGRIDRVDQSTDGEKRYLRVIDYKTGAKTLALMDVWNGLNLQLLVYLDVVVTNAEEWLGTKAEIGGVFYYQVADPVIAAKTPLSPEEVERQRIQKLKMKGLMLADTELARLMDGETDSGSSDLIPFGLKKDGAFTANSSVATAEQFDSLQKYVRKTVQQISEQMLDGTIDIAPYSQGTNLACNLCDYKPVCQYDQFFEGNTERLLAKMKNNQIWDLLQGADGAGSKTLASQEGGEESS
ncbi:helicase-exonuclease AddAB subunit AddB [Brevibacillus ginsengisoli]|uniref:helicase-exonuclease AddAB subunit AddB n=1 Tax=Brevibacillus ginsengisoli TaxID=363854 RepID=UPI003CEFB8C3